MLSKTHEQDIRSLSKLLSNRELDEYWAVHIGKRYGSNTAYRYLDTLIQPKQSRTERLKQSATKLLTKIINHLKQWKNDKRRIGI